MQKQNTITTLGLSILLAVNFTNSVTYSSFERSNLMPSTNVEYPLTDSYYFDPIGQYTNNAIVVEKEKIIIDFSQKLINNMIDIDSEYVEIVNNNFWDLL